MGTNEPGTPRSEADRPTSGSLGGDRWVPALYAAVLGVLLLAAVLGGTVHPLVAAGLGLCLAFCLLGWPAYYRTLQG